MKVKSVAGTAALNVAVSLVLLVAGIGGGLAVGVMNGHSTASASATEPTSHIAGFQPVQHYAMAGVTVSEAAAPAAPARKTVRKVVTQSSASRSGDAAGGGAAVSVAVAGGGSGPAAGSDEPCTTARLDDRKVNWLINLVHEARESNPDQAAVADRAEASLRGALGKNMCADEAQVHINNMCADEPTRKFMGLMVKELPFFVRPLVGDPCGHDLVAAAEKWLP